MIDHHRQVAAEPIADIFDEARRIFECAHDEGLPIRLLGGVAVALLAPNRPEPLRRQIGDLDFVIDSGNGNKAERLLRNLGYQSDRPFNIAGRPERLRMLDEVNNRHVDLFVGKFRMCHEIPLAASGSETAETIPAHELLLTKLQIINQSPKDVIDVLALLHYQDLTENFVTSIASVCASDWGLWKTVLRSIFHCRSTLEHSPLDPSDRKLLRDRLTRIEQVIEAVPKSRAWKWRSRIGTHRRWYALPEEVT